ncbi:MAG: DEAD/DEAH box helicase [Chloroflexi bacterium HGW-Chloroflexi-1]|nr:MAG: DEAD/DEAH box helicase [Chloroflexi bacterium HGW-Chloroflexi-1]
MTFNPDAFLDDLRRERGYAGQLVYVQTIPARKPRYGRLRQRLSPPVAAALRAAGVEQLYTHQAEAINAALAGQNVVVATSTASGKTLCFNVPVLEALARDPLARALYIYPTKALAQDQLGKWRGLAAGAQDVIPNLQAATYDGDTARGARTRIRKTARVLLTNPDMLHAGILPNHPLWAEFFRRLKYVVIDEAHTYRGVFGSQVACVLRRLRRVCDLYQGTPGVGGQGAGVRRQGAGVSGWQMAVGVSSPQFIATSATIANPAEHFELLTGLPATVISDDGSPHGPRVFAFWNPPFLDRTRTARRSANREATDLFTALVGAGVRTIAFTRARVVAELLLRYAREGLQKSAPAMAGRIAAYRAGYLAEDRRRIERDLFGGRLLGVTATSALELGIDVGGLDAALLVGYPGTVASTWQQAGRAGRGEDPALAVLIGLDNPLDQFYMRHGADLLTRPHENALIDPDNVYILQRHLPCAAHEAPLAVPHEDGGAGDGAAAGHDDEALFGPGFVDAMITLEEADILRYNGERWVYTRGDYPAQEVNLRDAAGERFAILNAAETFGTLEEISSSSAPFRVHPGAIYLHQGESYLVTEYNYELRHAIVRPVTADYYTQPREVNDVRIVRSLRHRVLPTTVAYLGRVRQRSQVIGFRRLQQFSEAVLGDEPLEMPVSEFDTVALWFDLPPEMPAELARRGLDFLGGIHAVEHAAIGILPLFAMCDRWDIGGFSTPRHPDTDAARIFIYDGFPGGVGIAEKGFELLPELWAATLDVIQGCPCADGCPSCVQSPKCGNFNQPLDKRAAATILGWLC